MSKFSLKSFKKDVSSLVEDLKKEGKTQEEIGEDEAVIALMDLYVEHSYTIKDTDELENTLQQILVEKFGG